MDFRFTITGEDLMNSMYNNLYCIGYTAAFTGIAFTVSLTVNKVAHYIFSVKDGEPTLHSPAIKVLSFLAGSYVCLTFGNTTNLFTSFTKWQFFEGSLVGVICPPLTCGLGYFSESYIRVWGIPAAIFGAIL